MSLNSQGSFSRGAPLVSRQQRGYFLRDCWRFLWQDKGLFLAWVSASLCSCLAYFLLCGFGSGDFFHIFKQYFKYRYYESGCAHIATGACFWSESPR